MAQGWKIGISAFCALFALALSLPSYAASGIVGEPDILLIACDAYSDPVVHHTTGTVASVMLPVNTYPQEYSAIIGAKFESFKGLTYTFDFTLGNGYDSYRHTYKTGHYANDLKINSFKTNELFYSFLGSETNAYQATFTQKGTNTGNQSVVASFSYNETRDNNDYKTFGIEMTRARMTSSGSRFTVLLSAVTISYQGELDGQILDKLNQTANQLGYISGSINYLINDVKATQEQISDLKNYVGEDGDKTRDTVIRTAEETQEAIDRAADQAHQDADRAHDDAENAPNNEYDKGMEKDKELQGDVDDLEKSFDLSEINGSFTGMMENLWSLLSSRSEQKELVLQKAEVNLDLGSGSKKIKFWDNQKIDFRPWLENHYVKAIIGLVKFLCLIYLITWAVEFVYSIISWFLGDTDQTIGDIIFGFNVFR